MVTGVVMSSTPRDKLLASTVTAGSVDSCVLVCVSAALAGSGAKRQASAKARGVGLNMMAVAKRGENQNST
jgi:hypothetical protein